MRILASMILMVGAAFASSQVMAECSCLCVDGELKTVCTSADEAGAGPALCGSLKNLACPEAPALDDAKTYDPPDGGAENCRDAQVYDVASGDYLPTKICDMASAQ